MKFTLKLNPHKVGNLMHIVAVQINDDGKVINETNVGYIERKYSDRIEFTEKTDWGGKLMTEIEKLLLQTFIMGMIWSFLLQKIILFLFENIRKLWRKSRKSSAEFESAKLVKKKQSNYNISEFKNINNLERWKWWQLTKK